MRRALGITLLLMAPTAEAGDAELAEALRIFNLHAHSPLPVLSAAQRAELMAGEIIKVLDSTPDGSGARRAVAFMLVPMQREPLWLACQDPHSTVNDMVTEHRLGWVPPDRARWYGLMDLPRPFDDRHWVVDSWNNVAMAQATGGASWEHPWARVPGGVEAAGEPIRQGQIPRLTETMWADALELPTNQGAWNTIALSPDSTLLIYHAATSLGGNIPEGLVLQFVKSSLDKTLRQVVQIAGSIEQHYRAGHEPIVGGDGQPLPTY